MENLDDLFDIYHSLHEKYENDSYFDNFREKFIDDLSKLYGLRIRQYERRKRNEHELDIRKILRWLVKNDTKGKTVWQRFLNDFDEQCQKDKNTAEGLPTIEYFISDKKYIVSGVEAELSWYVRNAQKLTLYEGHELIETNGKNYKIVCPYTSYETIIKTFTLTATNELNKKDIKQLELVVFPVPNLELIKTVFPEFEKATNLALDVSVPSFDTYQEMNNVLTKVAFYPEIFTTVSNLDSINTTYKSPFNIYFIYGRIKNYLKKSGAKEI